MNYYRKPVDKTVNDVKLKMQMAALTLKLSENINKIDDLVKVDKNIKKDIDGIKLNLTNVENDLSDLEAKENIGNYSIQKFFIYDIKVVNNYTLNKDSPRCSIFNYDLIDEFRTDNILEINCRILYQYSNYNNIGILLHNFKLCDGIGKLFYEYKSIKVNSGDNRKNDILQHDLFYVNQTKIMVLLKLN